MLSTMMLGMLTEKLLKPPVHHNTVSIPINMFAWFQLQLLGMVTEKTSQPHVQHLMLCAQYVISMIAVMIVCF